MLKTLKIILLVGLSLINGDFDSKKLNNTPMSIYNIPINSIDGNEMNLNEYKAIVIRLAHSLGYSPKSITNLFGELEDNKEDIKTLLKDIKDV